MFQSFLSWKLPWNIQSTHSKLMCNFVSILLIVEVTLESSCIPLYFMALLRFNPSYRGSYLGMEPFRLLRQWNRWFQSFLSWKLPWNAEVQAGLKSATDGFNPSYRGSYLGIFVIYNFSLGGGGFQSFLSWKLPWNMYLFRNTLNG